MNLQSLIADVLFLCGLALIAAGAWMISPAAGCIFIGAAAVALAVGMTWTTRKGNQRGEK